MGVLLEGADRFLVTQPNHWVAPEQARLRGQHQHTREQFLFIGGVVTPSLVPFPVPMAQGNQDPFVLRVFVVSGWRFVVSGTRRSSAPGGHLAWPADILPTWT